MSQSPKGKPDFSDIDNLDRATEVFMRGQRKALEGYRPPRRKYFKAIDLHKISRFAAVFAVLAVIVGTVVFAGIRFGRQDDGLRQPEPEKPPAVTNAVNPAPSEPEPETTAPTSVTELTETAAPPHTILTAATTQSSASEEATESETAAPRTTAQSSETSSSSSRTTTSGSSSAQTQHVLTAATAPPATTVTSTSTSRTTTTTTSTTARSSTRLTTRSTTSSTTTTTTTTTTAAKAVITIKRVNVADDLTEYNGNARQTVYITVENTGNAALSGTYELMIKCVNAGTISHAGCQSGNVATGIVTSGECVYFKYKGALAPGASDTIQMTIISEDPIWRCSF